MLIEEADGFVTILDETIRLGFEADVQQDSAFVSNPLQFGSYIGESQRAGMQSIARRVLIEPGLVGDRRGRDAAFGARHDSCQYAGETKRVLEALFGAPVRCVDVILHPPPVKSTVGKAVEREHVKAQAVEPLLELIEATRHLQASRGRIGKT